MTKIGLLSDTHTYWDEKFAYYFAGCDEIWHAGDIGNENVLYELQNLGKTVRAVHGNVDGNAIRLQCSSILRFKVEEVEVWLTHIGGYPGKYEFPIGSELIKNPPDLFVCGHSHILKIIYDKQLQMLHLNPGAAGKYGFHTVRTLLRFAINGKAILNMEIIELK